MAAGVGDEGGARKHARDLPEQRVVHVHVAQGAACRRHLQEWDARLAHRRVGDDAVQAQLAHRPFRLVHGHRSQAWLDQRQTQRHVLGEVAARAGDHPVLVADVLQPAQDQAAGGGRHRQAGVDAGLREAGQARGGALAGGRQPVQGAADVVVAVDVRSHGIPLSVMGCQSSVAACRSTARRSAVARRAAATMRRLCRAGLPPIGGGAPRARASKVAAK